MVFFPEDRAPLWDSNNTIIAWALDIRTRACDCISVCRKHIEWRDEYRTTRHRQPNNGRVNKKTDKYIFSIRFPLKETTEYAFRLRIHICINWSPWLISLRFSLFLHESQSQHSYFIVSAWSKHPSCRRCHFLYVSHSRSIGTSLHDTHYIIIYICRYEDDLSHTRTQ